MIHIEFKRLHGWGWRWAAYVMGDRGYPIHLAIGMTKRSAERRLWQYMNVADGIADL